MKTLNETFTEREYSEIKRIKRKINQGMNWRQFLLQAIRNYEKNYKKRDYTR